MIERPLTTRSQLARDLRALGLAPGQVVMLHASVRAIGWVVGGPDVVLHAIRDVLGPSGTLMMYVGWEDCPYHVAERSADRQRAYREEMPAFDPATSRANRRGMGILAEYLRTTPGARRSAHPEASIAAVGPLAEWLTAPHPLQYGHGPGTPLARLCESEGQVLLLGAPLNTITLLHHAEHLADVPDKRVARYALPVLRDGERVWVEIEEFDTSRGIRDWPGGDYFAEIAREFLARGGGRRGRVGAATAYLFPAAPLVAFAVRWMERAFGADGDPGNKRSGRVEAGDA